MKIKFFTIMVVLFSASVSYGEYFKITEKENMIWESNVRPFLMAFYRSDYKTAWELGKEAYKNYPHNIKSKKDFLMQRYNEDHGTYDGIVITSRNVQELYLNRVDHMSDGEYFYAISIYNIIAYDKSSRMILSCKRMEKIIFRVKKENNKFDRFIGIGNTPLNCSEGKAT